MTLQPSTDTYVQVETVIGTNDEGRFAVSSEVLSKLITNRKFVEGGTIRWINLILDWLQYGKDVIFLYYEEIVQDPAGQIRKVLGYFGMDCHLLSCTVM